MLDPELGIQIINETDVDSSDVFRSLNEQYPEMAALVRWSYDTQPKTSLRHGGLFDRDRYVTPGNVFQQFRTAQEASECDDVVAGVLESTEALVFSRMSMDCDDEDQTDVWNQIAEDLDLDSRLREMWREDFVVSQCYVAVWHGIRSYKVRGKSEQGITRKKKFQGVKVPIGMSILDPMKIVPVGNFMFGQEQLAYIADRGEYDVIRATIEGQRKPDEVIQQLMLRPYEPDEVERRLLQESGAPADRLFLLNPDKTFRHTSTRPDYKRFADVRMRSVFELLDMKQQLKAMDRAHLIGGTNFIILVKKGSDLIPGKPAEIQALQSQVRTLARVPVIVGDHRLSIEIITPDQDYVLLPEKYNGLDSRITARLFGMFMTGNYSAGAKGDDSLKLAKVVAKGLESRRHMIRRTVEEKVFEPCFEANDDFTEEPQLRFHPKRIALDFDPTFANFLLDLRDRGDLSRESILEEVDFDQVTEWRRRKNEKAKYDDVFETTIPYSAGKGTPDPTKVLGGGGAAPMPGPNKQAPSVDPKAAGRQGGRRGGGTKGGGGAAPGTGQGQAPTDLRKRSARGPKQ